jgi:hypothetical protein
MWGHSLAISEAGEVAKGSTVGGIGWCIALVIQQLRPVDHLVVTIIIVIIIIIIITTIFTHE